jgi:hypothetical protein
MRAPAISVRALMTAELSQTLPKSSKIGYASFVFCCSGRVCLVTFLQQQAVQESRTRNDAPECASMDARHSFQATIVRWRHTFFSTATDALIASASSMLRLYKVGPMHCRFLLHLSGSQGISSS